MHSNEMEDIDEAKAGDVVAVFGVSEVASMDTFTDGSINYALNSMFVPAPVMSLSIKPKDSMQQSNFGKAIGKFTREDPTLRIMMDPKSKETVMSGMGELHLEIYIERMNREYKCPVTTGQPRVAYKEAINQKSEFNYLHKKQTGGSGQFGKVIGYIEPIGDDEEIEENFVFENQMVGNNIPPEYITAVEKGFEEAMGNGPLIGYQVQGVRVVLQDGAAHAVDSSEMAFKTASKYARMPPASLCSSSLTMAASTSLAGISPSSPD